jgi:4-carboxymuconolactone decarboxylase
MSRIPYPDPKDIPAEVQALLDARPPRNVFRMLAHTPALMPGLMELTGAILYRSKLEPVLRELVILRVGHLCRSSYEVQQHNKIAAAIGLSPEKIAGTARGADPKLYQGRELLVLRVTEQVIRNVKAEDALFAQAAKELGHELLMELLVVIGLYVMLAQVLENCEVALEEGGGPSQEDVSKIFGGQHKGPA